MRRPEGRRILLADGDSGIGRAVASAYLVNDTSVTVLERSLDHARELVELSSPDVDVLVGDATDSATSLRTLSAADWSPPRTRYAA